jgi:hypothetical protein
MAASKTILARIFFWSYERGTWQYDIAVVLILIFVLLTPRAFFRDEPQIGLPAGSDQVQLVLFSDDGHRQEYRVDARVLAPPEQTPALQNELHQALQRALPDLRSGRFSISKIEALRNGEGTVIAYQVEIRR